MFKIPNLKYIKPYNFKLKYKIKNKNKFKFNQNYTIIALTAGYLYFSQIQASRIFLRKKLGKKSHIFINVSPNNPYSFKPKETRMGRGKGNNCKWLKIIKPGTNLFILFNINITNRFSKELIRHVKNKLPFHIKLIKRKYNILFLNKYLKKKILYDYIIY